MKAIQDILKTDYKTYDDYRFSYFFEWCLKQCTDQCLPLQSLVTSKPLYDWYCQQWLGVVETAFKNDFKAYIQANVNDPNTYLELLSAYPKTIEGYYPSVILYMIKNELKPQKKNENVH
ncbi:hypothetical protein [Yeosuana marina]|uniref:hypothetical protein n=1 Tax=Yeosuana marina TaxID=1565536 RepID=UPI00141EB4D6|nr:hypothetical protein [Yeosuana marina]